MRTPTASSSCRRCRAETVPDRVDLRAAPRTLLLLRRFEGDGDTPILIATPDMDIPARPMLLNLRDAAPSGSFERVLEVVPADPSARGPLRERWKHYQSLGFEVNKHDM